ncbi:kynureninase [Nocardioides insulae]|uniref:kynureninase n=1 Tax=Nocardioides insulae TaxID=394734 RepID=UPI00041CB9BF|nr:kynureninase [Nocardioides insulae]
MSDPLSRAVAVARDRADPLREWRAEFALPQEVIYLDGNSLGALPRRTAERVRRTIEEEWGQGLVRSWNDAGWFDQPRTLGDRVAPLIGAGPGEVVVCDSTSLNLFKVLTAALGQRPGRDVVVTDLDSFPTDLYMIQGATSLLGGYELRYLTSTAPDLDDLLDERVAAVVLTHVDYRTGEMYDLDAVTRRVQEAGALMIWDLCHSVGAVPVDLTAAGADFAVGCTYKYLNGGPGAPAFLYAAERHLDRVTQPLSGWHGHAAPFAFTPDYEPAPGISRFLVGSPGLLGYAALEASLDLWDRVPMAELRTKSLALTDLFLDLVQARLGDQVEPVTPRDHAVRGSQVSLRHPHSYEVMQNLIARGVIGDVRAPDLMRFGFTPLYVRFQDVWDAVDVLDDILTRGTWREPRFAVRRQVT